MIQWLLLIIVVLLASLVWQVRRVENEQRERSGSFSTTYPVVPEGVVRQAERYALTATILMRQAEADLEASPLWSAAKVSGEVGPELRALMDKFLSRRMQLDIAWNEHARMMEANLSVLTGKSSRVEAWRKWSHHNNSPVIRDTFVVQNALENWAADVHSNPIPSDWPYESTWYLPRR